MTPDEREEMNRLCTQIQEEKDQKKLQSLVSQLNDLLERTKSTASPGNSQAPNRANASDGEPVRASE